MFPSQDTLRVLKWQKWCNFVSAYTPVVISHALTTGHSASRRKEEDKSDEVFIDDLK